MLSVILWKWFMSSSKSSASRAERKCRSCGIILTPDNAYLNRVRSTPQSSCKECGRKYAKSWRATNRDRERKRSREYYNQNRDHLRIVYDRSRVIRKYGLTPEQIVEMKAQQKHLCAICLTRQATDVDHHHASGAVRKILCQRSIPSPKWG